MTVTRSAVLDALGRIVLPDGGDLVSRDLVRALGVEAGAVRFVIEAPDAETAQRMAPVRAAAEAAGRRQRCPSYTRSGLPGVAHGNAGRAGCVRRWLALRPVNQP